MLVSMELSLPCPFRLHLDSESRDKLSNPSIFKWIVEQFVAKLHVPHLQATYHVFRYLKGTFNDGLFFSFSSSLSLIGYSDANDTSSVWAYCVFLGSSLVY